MKKISLFNSRVYIAFCAKALLFPIFFASTILISAHTTVNVKDTNIKKEISEAISDSLFQNSDDSQVIQVFVSEGATIYNTGEIKGRVEFVQTKPAISIKKKSQVSKNTSKFSLSKHKKLKKERAVNVQFKRIPSESDHFIFSKSKGDIVIVPPTNAQLTILILRILFDNYTAFSVREKHNSKYRMPIANEISHWQIRIRPPPTV